MKIFFFSYCKVIGVFSATIFDHRISGRKAVGLKRFPSVSNNKAKSHNLENDASKRHINTFRVLNSDEKVELERRMEDKTQKFNDDTSNGWFAL